MYSHKEQYVTQAAPLETSSGVFDVHIFGHEDGRRHAYFAPGGTEPSQVNIPKDTTRIAYRDFDGKVMFLGMIVEKGLRGQGMGDVLVRHFFAGNIEPAEKIIETATIHKPLIAKSLQNVGLTPLSRDCEVEILPRSAYDDSLAPKIHILRSEIDPASMVDASPTGKFYEIIDPATVLREYPLGTPDMTVALHTRFQP